MKIIELLNKIANDEEVPEKIHIKQFQCDFKFNNYTYVSDEKQPKNIYWCLHSGALNYEVEIIEEEAKPLTKQDLEALGYACGEIRKCFINGWNKSLEEDKKIEKIDIKWDKDYYFLDEDNVKRYLNERDKIEMNKINEIIDYLMENKQ